MKSLSAALLVLVTGCGSTFVGNACDVIDPIYYVHPEETVRYLIANEPMAVIDQVTNNRTLEKCPGSKKK